MYDAAVTTRDEYAHAAPGKSPVGAALVFLYLVGIYTHVTVFVAPGIPWPAAAAGLAGILLFIKNAYRIHIRHVAPIFLFVLIGLFSMLFAPDSISLLGERAQSLLLLTYSLVVGYGLYLELVQWRRGKVARLFFVVSTLILIGCALENFTAFGAISDSFRGAVFPEEFLYVANLRDQSLFGMVRPKLFTAEPSFVAIFFVFSITIWLVLSASPLRFVSYFLFLAVGLFLIRSPVLLIGAVTGGAACFAPASSGPRAVGAASLNKIVLVGLALGVGAVFLYVALTTVLSERLDVILSGSDDSFTIRVIAPIVIAWETITRYPFFGAGIGGREAILDIILQTYLPIVVRLDHIYYKLVYGITSVFWLHWIFFGLVGGSLALLAIVKLMRCLGGGPLMFPAIVILSFSHTMGAYVGPRFWSIFFIVLAATYLARQPPTPTGNKMQWITRAGHPATQRLPTSHRGC